MSAEPQLDVLRAFDRHHLQSRGADARIERHEHADVVTLLVQLTRQCARDIGEPAGLRERRDLGGDEADPHRAAIRRPLLSAGS
jgi:hypothetical protein